MKPVYQSIAQCIIFLNACNISRTCLPVVKIISFPTLHPNRTLTCKNLHLNQNLYTWTSNLKWQQLYSLSVLQMPLNSDRKNVRRKKKERRKHQGNSVVDGTAVADVTQFVGLFAAASVPTAPLLTSRQQSIRPTQQHAFAWNDHWPSNTSNADRPLLHRASWAEELGWMDGWMTQFTGDCCCRGRSRIQE